MMIEAIQWRNTMGNFATGVTIITTVDEKGQPLGMTANAFTSLSLDPPMVLICVDNGSSTLTHLINSKKYCVNILSGEQEAVSRQFAKKGGSEKFESVDYRLGELNVPVIDKTLASIECEIVNIFDGGDHKILVGEGKAIHQLSDIDEPLLFYKGKYRKLVELEVVSQ